MKLLTKFVTFIVLYLQINTTWQHPLPSQTPKDDFKSVNAANKDQGSENIHSTLKRDIEAEEEAKYNAQQEAAEIEKNRAQVNNAHLWGGLDTGGLYRGLPKNLQTLTDLLILESKDPKYEDFFSWVFQNLVDPGDHAERMIYMKKNIPVDIPAILRTTEFPIPEKLQVFYANVIHLDRLRGKVPDPGHIWVIFYIIYSFANKVTHQKPLDETTVRASSVWANEIYTTPTLPELLAIMKLESQNPEFRAFFAWLAQAMGDEKRKEARIEAMATYQMNSYDKILRTTPFPVPGKLEHLFAFLYDIDCQLAEKKAASAASTIIKQ